MLHLCLQWLRCSKGNVLTVVTMRGNKLLRAGGIDKYCDAGYWSRVVAAACAGGGDGGLVQGKKMCCSQANVGGAYSARSGEASSRYASSGLQHVWKSSCFALWAQDGVVSLGRSFGNGMAGKRGFAAAADLPSHEQLSMPALSPTMAQGNIVAWKKKEGDAIQPGDVYCEVETDKATIEWEAQEEGFLAKILYGDGSQGIDVGTPVAVLVEEEGDVAAFAEYTAGSAPAAAAAPEPVAAAAPASSSGSSFPPHEVMSMPALSPTMAEGTLLKWKKAVGDDIAAGDVLAEIETDKATMEWEAQEDGVLAQILVPEGTSGVQVGSPVFIQVDNKDAVSEFSSFTIADAGTVEPPKAVVPDIEPVVPPPATPQPISSPAKKTVTAPPSTPRPSGDRVIASPYARKLAAEKGVDLAHLLGTGPGGRIVAADVQDAPAGGAAVSMGMAATGFIDIQNSNIRKVIAQRLLESKQQIPHYYLSTACRIDSLSAVRAKLNATLAASDGGKISMNDFVIKASAMALKRFPEANASWHGDFIRQYSKVDCSVAVQTPAGLMVPIVRNADTKGLAAISSDVKSLAAKAREGKLQPQEYEGGTFTVSNLGMFGVSQFAAIVNPPQACILAVGSAEKKVVPSADGNGFEEGTFVTVTLSCDHRVIDGAVGAQWLQAFKGFLEDPASMLL